MILTTGSLEIPNLETMIFRGENVSFRECMGVSKNRVTPKSSILIGFSIINHPFCGTPIVGNTRMLVQP